MRLLAIDVGNTRTKTALWQDDVRMEWDGGPVDMALASVTGKEPDWERLLPGVKVDRLSQDTLLPIGLDYRTPHTLGADRKAAACGAWALRKGRGCVVVDAGTCITIDYLDSEGIYRGGAILPGIRMKFEALNTFTAKLPLLNNYEGLTLPANGLTGKTTEESMTAGVVTATKLEVGAFVAAMLKAEGGQGQEPAILLAGGDAAMLADGIRGDVAVEKDLVLIGLKEIMQNRIYEK